jgi:hypothetical protein
VEEGKRSDDGECRYYGHCVGEWSLPIFQAKDIVAREHRSSTARCMLTEERCSAETLQGPGQAGEPKSLATVTMEVLSKFVVQWANTLASKADFAWGPIFHDS